MTAKPFTSAVIARAIRARLLQALHGAEQARREALKTIENIESIRK